MMKHRKTASDASAIFEPIRLLPVTRIHSPLKTRFKQLRCMRKHWTESF
jgi:hypothetical protein